MKQSEKHAKQTGTAATSIATLSGQVGIVRRLYMPPVGKSVSRFAARIRSWLASPEDFGGGYVCGEIRRNLFA